MAHMLCFDIFIFAILITGSWEQTADGTRPNICDLTCKKDPMEFAFVIDSSSSIQQGNFTEALWFVGDLIDVFDISPNEVRVAAVTYGDGVYKEDGFGFDAYTEKHALKQAINNIPYKAGQRTATADGIQYIREHFLPTGRSGAKKICVVLTDSSSQNGTSTALQTQLMRDKGVEMFAVGIGQRISERELRNIAGEDSHVFVVSSYKLLATIRSSLAFKTCDRMFFKDLLGRKVKGY